MTGSVRGVLKRVVLHNRRTKLMALLVAVVAFHSIRNVISEERYFRVRVVPSMPQEGGVTVVNADPGEARVTLRGSRDQLNAIEEGDLALAVVPPHAPTGGGAQEVALRASQMRGHRQTRVVNLEPSSVQLTFDVEGDVRISVARPKLKGAPLIGNAEVLWTDTSVIVRGPLNQLQTLRDNAVQLATEEIDVDGRVQSFSRRVKVIPPKDLGIVRVVPEEIEVRIGITVETVSRVFDNIPVLLTAVTGSGVILTSEPATVTVRVTGMAERLSQLQPERISVVADCRGITVAKETVAQYPVRVFLPLGLEGLSPEAVPDQVVVRARRVLEPEPTPPSPSVRPDAPETAEAPAP